ncbi:MAG: O-methyltransferase [Phycisphaerales bacterium]|jgi:caffeoyl-CoA O-methyltransferase|nr:O-methyltransferase [Phycisphaerales bacterium]
MASRKAVISVLTILSATLVAYVALAQPARRRGPTPAAGEVKTEIKAKDASEKKILDVLADLDKNQRRGMMNVPVQDGRLLRLLAESTGAKQVVEIGTSNGYSGIWICLALRKTGGKLITHEIDEKRAKLARENFKRAGVEKLVTLVFGDAHKEIANIKAPVDMIFLDADKSGYIDYLKKLLPKVRPGGLIIAHNVRSQAGSMKPYLEAINTDKNLETLYLHMSGTGVSVSMKKR